MTSYFARNVLTTATIMDYLDVRTLCENDEGDDDNAHTDLGLHELGKGVPGAHGVVFAAGDPLSKVPNCIINE